jgi:hypothetical protein
MQPSPNGGPHHQGIGAAAANVLLKMNEMQQLSTVGKKT